MHLLDIYEDLSKKLWKIITNLQLTYRQAEEVDDIRFENEEQRKKKPIKTRLEIYTLYASFCVNSCSLVNLLFKWIQSVINKEFLSKPM